MDPSSIPFFSASNALALVGFLLLGSTAAGRRFHNPVLADPAAAVAYAEREWTPDVTRTRYDWLFEYDATTAPV